MFLRNNNLHIRRFEFKYLVSVRQLDQIRKQIHFFANIDKHAKDLDIGRYYVKSLYFDDLSYSSYFEKLAGVKKRKKLRIRTYDSDLKNSSRVFLELKRRDDVVVFKDRLEGSYGEIRDLLKNSRYDLIKKRSSGTVENFFNAAFRHHVLDTVIVEYEREAYFDKNNSSFRVTIDENLRASRSFGADLLLKSDKFVLPGYAVVEAKFNRVIPAWFGMLIKSSGLKRVSFSKYCLSMEFCGIVRKHELPNFQWI